MFQDFGKRMVERGARRFAARLAALIVAAFAFAAPAPAADLTGSWTYTLLTASGGRDVMGTVSIVQYGTVVTGAWSEIDPRKERSFGFEKGEPLIEGKIDGATLKGRLRLHYPIANRTACPEGWQTWGDIEIALPDQSTNRVQGQFRASKIDPANCTVTETGPQSFVLERVVPPAPPGAETAAAATPPAIEETAAADDTEPPVAGTPDRIDIVLDQVSASPGQGLTLRVVLRNEEERRVTADKLYRIRLSAEDARVTPDAVEIAKGASAASASVVGERPGEVPIRAASVEDDLKEGTATAITCGSDTVTRIVLNAESEESTVGKPIEAVVSLQNDSGVEVTGGAGNKRVRVEVKGVGRFASPGRDMIEDGRCATKFLIAATRAGTSPVSVSLAALPPETRTFRFVLPTAYLGATIVVGGLLGGLARSGQNWKNSQRWKLGRWLVTLGVGIVAGVAVYLIYDLGLVQALPELPLGYGPALLLSIVGGYLGPAALDRVSNKILPA